MPSLVAEEAPARADCPGWGIEEFSHLDQNRAA